MSTETATATNGVEATPDVKSTSTPVSADKGKSPESATKKGAASDPEDDSESGESEIEGEGNEVEEDEEEDDDMAEIDTDNIVSGGRRTRGKDIDFAKAAEGLDDEEEEEEDGDFEDNSRMEE